MSTLILFLPQAPCGPTTAFSYTLTADGHTELRHASAPAALLPEPARPGGEVVAKDTGAIVGRAESLSHAKPAPEPAAPAEPPKPNPLADAL